MSSTLAERLREYREYARLSQQEFGDRCGLSQKMVSNLEKGRAPKASYLDQIEAAFPELNMQWLRKGIGEMMGPSLAAIHTMHPTIQPADKELTSGTQTGPTMFVNDAGTLEGHWKMIAEERAARLADKDQEIERLMQQLEAWQEAFRKPLASAEAAAHLTYTTSTPIGPRFDNVPANMWVNREPQAPQVVELEEAA